MSNQEKSDQYLKKGFRKMKRRIFLRMLLMGALAVILGWFLLYFLIDGVLQDPFGRCYLWFTRDILGVEEQTALYLYYEYIQRAKTMWLSFAFVLLLLFLLYLSLNRITRYFRQTIEGVHALASGDDAPISMPRDLDFMERELNQVKEELKRQKYIAVQSEQRKNELVMYLAHDLKTPLTSVIGYLTLLRDKPGMPQETRCRYTGIALAKAERLEQLINEFFDITRFSLNRVPLNISRFDLGYMLLQMADEFYPLVTSQGKAIEVQAPSVMVEGDSDSLARVFNNLLKNAVRYSSDQTEITVTAEDSPDSVTVSVANVGTKIPPEQLEQVFEKFYRLDEARSSADGAGLGLAIAKEIVEAHRGAISAQSHEGNTVFTVVLPKEAAQNI